jgi:hypothetical protein
MSPSKLMTAGNQPDHGGADLPPIPAPRFEVVRSPGISDDDWARMSAAERGKGLWVLTDQPIHGGSVLVVILATQPTRRVFASRWFPAGPFFGQRSFHKHMEGCILGEVPVPPAALQPVVPAQPTFSGRRTRFSPAELNDLVRGLAIEHVATRGEPITETELRDEVRRRCNAPIRAIDAAHAALDPSLRRGRGDRRGHSRPS